MGRAKISGNVHSCARARSGSCPHKRLDGPAVCRSQSRTRTRPTPALVGLTKKPEDYPYDLVLL